MPRIVIIGGSYAGLKALSTIYSQGNLALLDVTLVAPASHAYFNVAAPRLLSEPENFDKTITPLDELVAEITKKQAKFLRGSVTAVDLSQRKASVALSAGGDSTLEYDILVVASGTESKWAGFKVNSDHTEAKSAIVAASKALKSAKSVAVIGGGPTGVETAGEIAKEFSLVKVSLYTGSSAPLKAAAPSLSAKTTQKLEKLGVEIVNDKRIKAVAQGGRNGASKLSVTLENGEVSSYDVIFESYIIRPFSDFLPVQVKDDKGYVKTDASLLVKGHREVVAFGDIVSGSSKSIVDLKLGQAGIFSRTILKLLKDVEDPGFWTDATFKADESSQYAPVTHTLMVPISRDGGAGMAFGFPLPSIMIWFFKSKTFMMEGARSGFL